MILHGGFWVLLNFLFVDGRGTSVTDAGSLPVWFSCWSRTRLEARLPSLSPFRTLYYTSVVFAAGESQEMPLVHVFGCSNRIQGTDEAVSYCIQVRIVFNLRNHQLLIGIHQNLKLYITELTLFVLKNIQQNSSGDSRGKLWMNHESDSLILPLPSQDFEGLIIHTIPSRLL